MATQERDGHPHLAKQALRDLPVDTAITDIRVRVGDGLTTASSAKWRPR